MFTFLKLVNILLIELFDHGIAGERKLCQVEVRVTGEGTGEFTVNGKGLLDVLPREIDRLVVGTKKLISVSRPSV